MYYKKIKLLKTNSYRKSNYKSNIKIFNIQLFIGIVDRNRLLEMMRTVLFFNTNSNTMKCLAIVM